MRTFNRILGVLAGLFILLMSLLNTLEVILRSVFNHPTLWTLPISQYLLLLAAFFGGAYCLQTDGHVNVDFIIERLGRRKRTVLLFLGYVISFIYVAVVLYYAVQVAILSGRFGWDVVTTFPIPAVILYSAMIFGLGVLILTLFLKVSDLIKQKDTDIKPGGDRP
ncbi:MAG: TRAP transporter small permease [Syntrophorhabdaceae bacterium]|nr:TRAP transporter small permease [Syntrophorhabdaceae bacterium]